MRFVIWRLGKNAGTTNMLGRGMLFLYCNGVLGLTVNLLGLCIFFLDETDTSQDWILHCAGGGTEDGACSMEERDCTSEFTTMRVVNVWSTASLNESDPRLTISPVFEEEGIQTSNLPGLFPDKCTELRWFPRLNISWPHSGAASTYLVSIQDCNKAKGGVDHTESCEDKCYQVQIAKQKSQCQSQVITLTSSLIQVAPKGHIYVRVRNSNELSTRTIEASLSLPLNVTRTSDFTYIYGLPMYYRGLVPLRYQNLSRLDLLHWVSPLSIWNSSCSRQIQLQFQLIPQQSLNISYSIKLIHTEHWKNLIVYYQPLPSETTGRVTFSNLTEGKYYIHLKLNRTYCSPEESDCHFGKLWCIDSISGYIHISDQALCTESQVSTQNTGDSSRGMAIGIGVIGAILVGLVLVGIGLLRKIKQHTKDIPLLTKKALIIYCKENKMHTKVVVNLADLLKQHAKCDVALDEWCTKAIQSQYFNTWLNAEFRKADCIIVVGSEGAYHVIEAIKDNRYWPKLEAVDTSLGKLFPMAIRNLQGNVPSGCCTKALGVLFEYSNKDNVQHSLGEIVRKSHIYTLTSELGKMLQDIHKRKGCTTESFFNQWAKTIVESAEGVRLLRSISHAKEFYKNKQWFFQNYGESGQVPILTHGGCRSQMNNTYINNDTGCVDLQTRLHLLDVSQ